MRRSLGAAIGWLVFFGALAHANSLVPDCGGQCHKLAYCDFPAILGVVIPPANATDARCSCPPGTIDKGIGSYTRGDWSDIGNSPPPSNGTDCDVSGWTIRYVAPIDKDAFPGMDSTNPSAQMDPEFGYLLCPDDDVKGYFFRKVPNGDGRANPLTASRVFEVNCLYEKKPASVDSFVSGLNKILSEVLVAPQIYRWELPTTERPLQIPPTGMTVDSVHFKPVCAESGCWVIKGTLTTGEAFNGYEVFNTFFLPQADISVEHPQGDISFDYNYEAVDWTFQPAQHPCSSVNYEAGDSSLDRVSTCCINNPEVGLNGGFVANYRPTERFVSWAMELRCDEKFTSASGDDICWKAYNDQTTWDTAQLRCEAAGGNLASIKNSDENERLRKLIFNKGVGHAWVGLASRSGEDILAEVRSSGRPNALFEWTDGTVPTYRNFIDVEVGSKDVDGGTFLPNAAEYSYYIGDDDGYVDCFTFAEWLAVNGLNVSNGGTVDVGIEWDLTLCMGETMQAMMDADGGKWLVKRAAVDDGAVEEAQGYVCQFDWTCVPHVIQRPNYAAPPKPKPATCLEGHDEYVTWATAQANCLAQNGNLVTIHDAEDNFFVRRVAMKAGLDSVWLGFNDQANESVWEWVDGSPVTFTAWKEWDYWYFYLLRMRAWLVYNAADGEDVEAALESFKGLLAVYDYGYGYGTALYAFLSPLADVLAIDQSLLLSDADLKLFYDRFAAFRASGFTDFWEQRADPESYSDNLDDLLDCAWLSTYDAMWYTMQCNNTADVTARRQYICQVPREEAAVCHSDLVTGEDGAWDIAFPLAYQSFLDVGKFKGLNASPGVVNFTNTDPFFGQFEFEIQLDEVELRAKAGKLKGTVGVEHTVDTFLGIANFRPTGIAALDTFATQIAIHLEKTNFFSVSTHGVNDYTFLEYVNMRLVSVYWEDKDFSGNPTGMSGVGDAIGDDEATDASVRTDTGDNINYVQVTFTVGEQYGVNNFPNDDVFTSGLIPLDSVRVGRGTFLDAVDGAGQMLQTCSVYEAGGDATLVGLGAYAGKPVAKKFFYDGVDQDCAPNAAMCASPSSIPDQFVSFNIPLGSEVFDGQQDNSLQNNVFVQLVVNAIDNNARGTDMTTPNDGEAPWQVKTTLSASIPIVPGGINIFCDGVTAKTDLKDVANALLIVGTAASPAELTRLRIVEDIASTQMSSVESAQIDTDSIEAALMTLVLKGNSSYFDNGLVNSQGFSMELDDLITIHLMEDGTAGEITNGVSSNSKENTVMALLAEAPEDNSDSNGLDTDGYKLNGAFLFSINRDTARASLHPTAELLAACPFNPPRPDQTGRVSLETCIVRRDVRERGYPTRTGAAGPTAMELLKDTAAAFDGIDAELTALDNQYIGNGQQACTCASAESCCEAGFLTGILGANDYARNLAVDHIKAVHDRYTLNGRYVRAYWINPGYEWTPTQTAGKSLFSVSQKIYLFALVSLDENWSRRRMLLSTVADAMRQAGGAPGAAKVEFDVTPKSVMAGAFDVPIERVVLYEVEVQLTQAEACMPADKLQAALQATFEDYLKGTASPIHTAQVLAMDVDTAGVTCNRRVVRQLLQSFSDATASVRMMIVFKDEGKTSKFNVAGFQGMAGITSITPDAGNSAAIEDDPTFSAKPWSVDEDDGGGGSDITMIVGIAGGVGAAIVLAAGAVFWMKRPVEVDVAPISISISDIKSELAYPSNPA